MMWQLKCSLLVGALLATLCPGETAPQLRGAQWTPGRLPILNDSNDLFKVMRQIMPESMWKFIPGLDQTTPAPTREAAEVTEPESDDATTDADGEEEDEEVTEPESDDATSPTTGEISPTTEETSTTTEETSTETSRQLAEGRV